MAQQEKKFVLLHQVYVVQVLWLLASKQPHMTEYGCVLLKGYGRHQCLTNDVYGQTSTCTFFRLYENLSVARWRYFSDDLGHIHTFTYSEFPFEF